MLTLNEQIFLRLMWIIKERKQLLSAFGFCEYEDPEATLRCMRLLNEWEIAEKKLVVSVKVYDEHAAV